MKGTIVRCMQELTVKKFGDEKWKAALRCAGIRGSHVFLPADDVDDAVALKIMKGIREATSLSPEELDEAFGEHWSTAYALRLYPAFWANAKNSKELLQKLDYIHVGITRTMPFASPPRFRYEWEGDKVLIMHYQSRRGLINLMPGLIRGVGKHFEEDLQVSVSGNAVRVQFP